MGIGEKLKDLMDQHGRNANELSAKTGVPAQTIYSIIKRNNTKVDLDDLQLLANELGVSLDYFLTNHIELSNEGDEVVQFLDQLHKRPELKTLFSLTKNATKEDIEKTVKIIEMFKRDRDGDEY